jgi:hypothetical protein
MAKTPKTPAPPATPPANAPQSEKEAGAGAIVAGSGGPMADELVRLLEETGSASIDELRDMARVGHSLMAAIAAHSAAWPLKDWAPAEGPAEIVGDLVAMLHEERENSAVGSRQEPAGLIDPADILWPPAAPERITVTVIGPAKGMRRAGRAFGPEPVTIDVTADELKAIEADPMLAVVRGASTPAAAFGGAAERLTVADCLGAGGKPRPILVLGPPKGLRRAGFSFGPEARTVTPDREQLEAILADRTLSVTLANEAG